MSTKKLLATGLLISALLLVGLADLGAAHAPSSMSLDYNFDQQILFVTLTHTSPTTTNHYVETVVVYRNDVEVLEETYTSQPDTRTFTYEYEVTAVDGDILKVYSECNIGGDIEEEITVVGTREYMTLVVNPEPDEVEMEEDVDMTVNIYREDDDTSLDGVSIVPNADLGFIGDVSELGLGGYGFTYSAPDLDTEDIEVINLSCTKNGYHPLYYEFSFDLVLAGDDSKDIVVSLDPIFYNIDEGATKTIDVEVKAGGSFLDVDDIDVDYSHGSLEKTRIGAGRYELEYTANEVNSATTAFIRVKASMTGYVEGSRDIQFQIRDTGTQASDTDGGGDIDYNTIFIVAIIAVVIIVVVIVIILIGRRKKKPEEVQAVEVEEVYEQP
jgi:desulfoferrodoxin (superoxide reductase-like protein)